MYFAVSKGFSVVFRKRDAMFFLTESSLTFTKMLMLRAFSREGRAGPFSKAPGVRVRGSALEFPQEKLWLIFVLTMRVMKHWNRCCRITLLGIHRTHQGPEQPKLIDPPCGRVRPRTAAAALQSGFPCSN